MITIYLSQTSLQRRVRGLDSASYQACILSHRTSILLGCGAATCYTAMADTRCVDPEYQLDVDVMILEHLLYHAIRAHFHALRPRFEKQAHAQNDEHSRKHEEQEAQRSLHAFDCEQSFPSLPELLLTKTLQLSSRSSGTTTVTTLTVAEQASISLFWRSSCSLACALGSLAEGT